MKNKIKLKVDGLTYSKGSGVRLARVDELKSFKSKTTITEMKSYLQVYYETIF